MSVSNFDFSREPCGFDSRDSLIVNLEGLEDTTVQPPPAHLLPFLQAQRERLLRWQNLMKPPELPDTAPDQPSDNVDQDQD